MAVGGGLGGNGAASQGGVASGGLLTSCLPATANRRSGGASGGAGGVLTNGGGGGGGAGNAGNGGNGTAAGAAGAGGLGGPGGNGGVGGTGAPSTAGGTPGGGGGGASTTQARSAGGPGFVRVTSNGGGWGALMALAADASGDRNGWTWDMYSDAMAVNETRVGERYDGLGVWTAVPNHIGVSMEVGAVVSDLEGSITTAPGLTIVQPSNTQTAPIPEDERWQGVFAGGGCSGQGGQVYVPDFARRVQVQLAEQDTRFCGNEWRPAPQVGCQLVWYDDRGTVVDVAYQGLLVAGGNASYVPSQWWAVPARAVMLGVYATSDAGVGVSRLGFVHWRIAP